MQPTIETYLTLQKQVLQINENNFDEIAWQIFRFQAQHNSVYQDYLSALGVEPRQITKLEEIPFLPIQFFKSHTVKTGTWPTQRIYKSSGTTQPTRSIHHVWDEAFYLKHATQTFESFFGSLNTYHVLCLLPAYDTADSSLVAMARHFIAQSNSTTSGFFLENLDSIEPRIHSLKGSGRRILILGVTHALLGLAEKGLRNQSEILVMETGGMKGLRAELTREEVHNILKKGLGAAKIASEYGMTELLSQAYATGDTSFLKPNSMRLIVKELNDPFKVASSTGILNIIDLANLHSCCFIETKDLGQVTANGFQVLGRVDNSDLRGCNLLLS